MSESPRDWKALRGDIQALVDAGLTDEQIGQAFGVSSAHMCSVRSRLGIAARRKRGRQPEELPAPPPELPSYTDEDGNVVKRCPPSTLR